MCIECFHSRGQHICKFIGTKESVCIRKEFNSHRIGLEHQHGRRFIVLEHQYGRRDVMWKHSIVATLHLFNASCKITQHILLPIFLVFISSPRGIISFNISVFLQKGAGNSFKEKNQTRLTVTQSGGGGGGTHQSFIRRGSSKGPTPYPFIYHFRQKKYPFCNPSRDKINISNLEPCIPF